MWSDTPIAPTRGSPGDARAVASARGPFATRSARPISASWPCRIRIHMRRLHPVPRLALRRNILYGQTNAAATPQPYLWYREQRRIRVPAAGALFEVPGGSARPGRVPALLGSHLHLLWAHSVFSAAHAASQHSALRECVHDYYKTNTDKRIWFFVCNRQ